MSCSSPPTLLSPGSFTGPGPLLNARSQTRRTTDRSSQDAARRPLTLSTSQVPLEVLKISWPFSVHLPLPIGIVRLGGGGGGMGGWGGSSPPPALQIVVLVLGEHPISK